MVCSHPNALWPKIAKREKKRKNLKTMPMLCKSMDWLQSYDGFLSSYLDEQKLHRMSMSISYLDSKLNTSEFFLCTHEKTTNN